MCITTIVVCRVYPAYMLVKWLKTVSVRFVACVVNLAVHRLLMCSIRLLCVTVINRQLSDVNRDGALSLDEFCTAMHLVVLRRNDIELPDTLPPMLQPYTPLVTSGTSRTSFGLKQSFVKLSALLSRHISLLSFSFCTAVECCGK